MCIPLHWSIWGNNPAHISVLLPTTCFKRLGNVKWCHQMMLSSDVTRWCCQVMSPDDAVKWCHQMMLCKIWSIVNWKAGNFIMFEIRNRVNTMIHLYACILLSSNFFSYCLTNLRSVNCMHLPTCSANVMKHIFSDDFFPHCIYTYSSALSNGVLLQCGGCIWIWSVIIFSCGVPFILKWKTVHNYLPTNTSISPSLNTMVMETQVLLLS